MPSYVETFSSLLDRLTAEGHRAGGSVRRRSARALPARCSSAWPAEAAPGIGLHVHQTGFDRLWLRRARDAAARPALAGHRRP